MINIKLEKFQGPLGLLLQLIEKEEMDITEVNLANIADQYVSYIRKSSNLNPDEMADFLVVAARLLLIKSRVLLPYLCPAEEQEIEEFKHQLKMYQEFLEAAKKIKGILGRKKFMFSREFNKRAILINANIFSPPKKLSASGLAVVFRDIINGLEPAQQLAEESLERKTSIEDKILAIKRMLINKIKLSFHKVLFGVQSKKEIIVSFLAILELIKQREVAVAQDDLFGEIKINRI